MDTAQSIVDQVLEEVQNTPGVGVDNPSEVGESSVARHIGSECHP